MMRLIILLLLAAVPHSNESSYRFISFGIRGFDEVRALAVNAPRDVVGTRQVGFQTSAFLRRSDGTMQAFSLPGDQGNTELHALNDLGQMIGFYGVRGTNMGHSFLQQSDGTLEDFEAPGDPGSTFAFGLNNQGEIVGSVDTGNGTEQLAFIRHKNGGYETFRVGGALLTAAFGINDLGQVTGNYYTEGGTRSTGYIRADDGSIETFECPVNAKGVTFPIGINNVGKVVGSIALHSGFVRNPDGSFYELNYPGAYDTLLYGINDEGVIVGEWGDGKGHSWGFIATPKPGSPIWLLAFSTAIVGHRKAMASVLPLLTAVRSA